MFKRTSEPEIRVSGRTILELVEEYLSELDNPAPDYSMRQIYREWMRDMVKAHRE